ncbi:glucosidase II [Metarhizium acridum]|nr:glucosidase II [Metarhizium acridum]
MTLYGAIPFMQAHRKDSSVGVFWLNAAETWVDIVKAKDNKNPLSWARVPGLAHIPIGFPRLYGELTGYTAMPQEFSVGYHQCRWNYISDDDVKDVDRRMDKYKIPYDVIWLDIEYTEEKKYFTWDPHSFADPVGMGQQLDAHGRKLVVIIDPHIKKVDNYALAQTCSPKTLLFTTRMMKFTRAGAGLARPTGSTVLTPRLMSGGRPVQVRLVQRNLGEHFSLERYE